jgi:hypothetical protein
MSNLEGTKLMTDATAFADNILPTVLHFLEKGNLPSHILQIIKLEGVKVGRMTNVTHQP